MSTTAAARALPPPRAGVSGKNWLFTRRGAEAKEGINEGELELLCRASTRSPAGRGVALSPEAPWAVGWCGQTHPKPPT